MTAGMDLPSVGYAAAAGLGFAVANNLQRGAASLVPVSAGGPVRLILRLLRAPRWVLGSLLAIGALGLHAVALHRGGVILVQAILSSGLIAALVIEAHREHRRMRANELLGSALLVAGVVALLGGGRPGGGRSIDLQVQVVTASAVAVLAGIGLAALRAHHRQRASAVIAGITAGACFALDAVFLKGVANSTSDLDALLALLNLAGFVATSLVGNLIVQRAFQLAPLRMVLPAVTAADPLTAFVAGRWLLGERLHGGPAGNLAVTLGLAGIVAGIVITTAVPQRPRPADGMTPSARPRCPER